MHIHIDTYIHNTRLVFAIFRMFLPGNRVGSQVRGVKWKFDKYYFIHTINGHLPVQKIWFKYFPVFAAINHKGHFRKVLTGIFKFGWFSWYNSYIFKKVKLNYLMQNWWFDWHQYQIPRKKSQKASMHFYNRPFSFWGQFNWIKVLPLFQTILDSWKISSKSVWSRKISLFKQRKGFADQSRSKDTFL